MRKIISLLSIIVVINLQSQVNTLKESIYFGLGKTTLTRAHKLKLDSIVTLLKTSQSYVGEVKGYTCNLGSTRINRVVSNLRALNVLNYLVDRGIHRDNFTYGGLGSANPQGSNKTNSGRALNRRTDLEVVLSLFDETVTYTEDKVESNVSSTTVKPKERVVTPSNKTEKTTSQALASAPPVELGPDFSTGKIPKAGNKLIKSTNGITLEVDRNTLVSGSSEPIDLDFKDYTQNYDIIKKGLNTASGGCKNLSLIGAFSASFTQEYQELSLNSQKPLIVSIPSEYFPNAKLFTNPKNWTEDTVNKFRYNDAKKAYEVYVVNNTNVIGLFNDVPDTVSFLRVKIGGLSPESIKAYVIYDNCNISMCCKQTKKWLFFKSTSYLVPISTKSTSYKIRSTYTDFSIKNGASYSIKHDINNLDLSKLRKSVVDNVIIYEYPEKIQVTNQKLDKSSLCDQVPASN
jgi:hypothetical protein